MNFITRGTRGDVNGDSGRCAVLIDREDALDEIAREAYAAIRSIAGDCLGWLAVAVRNDFKTDIEAAGFEEKVVAVLAAS